MKGKIINMFIMLGFYSYGAALGLLYKVMPSWLTVLMSIIAGILIVITVNLRD